MSLDMELTETGIWLSNYIKRELIRALFNRSITLDTSTSSLQCKIQLPRLDKKIHFSTKQQIFLDNASSKLRACLITYVLSSKIAASSFFLLIATSILDSSINLDMVLNEMVSLLYVSTKSLPKLETISRPIQNVATSTTVLVTKSQPWPATNKPPTLAMSQP